MSHYSVYVFQTGDSPSIDDMLAPYDENLELDEPIVAFTKEDAVKKVRDDIEQYKNTVYKEYLSDKDGYVKRYSRNLMHLDYLENEFPKRLTWTDDECYEYLKSSYTDDMIDEDGNLLTTYNPDSKWDWYKKGGRWDGAIKTKKGEDVNKCVLRDVDIDKTATPYAFITPYGEWVEKGQMSFFGIGLNEMDAVEWDKKYREYVKGLGEDVRVTIIDCHI